VVNVGDSVSWNTSQGPTHGKIVERRTKDFRLDGQQFKASGDQPKFIVASDKTGARAAHAADALAER